MSSRKPIRAAQAARMLSPHLAGRDILEIACGTADFSLAAAEIARGVTAIDLDDLPPLPRRALHGWGPLSADGRRRLDLPGRELRYRRAL